MIPFGDTSPGGVHGPPDLIEMFFTFERSLEFQKERPGIRERQVTNPSEIKYREMYQLMKEDEVMKEVMTAGNPFDLAAGILVLNVAADNDIKLIDLFSWGVVERPEKFGGGWAKTYWMRKK